MAAAALGLVLVAPATGSAAVAPTSRATQQVDDPCRTREPTPLDRRPEWKCVGLAQFHTKEPRELPELELAEEEAKRLNEPGEKTDDWGVAVSPDGRLYVQVAPIAERGILETRPVNPDGREADPEEGARALLSILGSSDDRVIRLGTTAYPWRVLGAILPPGSTTSNCSGVLVGPRHFLTAGHCIHQDGAWFPNRKVAPGMRGIDTFPNGLKNHSWYYSVKGWFNKADKRYDYAMIILQDQASTASLGWFGWKSSGHSGGTWNFGYPGWWRTCAASPSPPQCSNFLYGDDGSIQTQNWGQLGHSSDTQPGQSGSPVYKYNNGDRRVIAIHAYGAGSTGQNWGTRIRSAVSENICNWIGTWPSAHNWHACY